ncbi:hypothetical protein DUNSADRAFT_4871 [Dunaliella salina]|uniref:Uncharacterized protein n=1 Tax=Dunaliella salina TaxID=3046 RepID=A0ABQ7GR54_DUNSA|nr:hypothetical protein DUNSADRAFT_4871 [Dunaliella salina]|eukprot:KAF5837090.1 hypothetical protein DUNSADRAFT_4871 [Dunaliella salina]
MSPSFLNPWPQPSPTLSSQPHPSPTSTSPSPSPAPPSCTSSSISAGTNSSPAPPAAQEALARTGPDPQELSRFKENMKRWAGQSLTSVQPFPSCTSLLLLGDPALFAAAIAQGQQANSYSPIPKKQARHRLKQVG